MNSILIFDLNLNLLSDIKLNLKNNEEIQSMKLSPNEEILLISTNQNHLYQFSNLV